MDTHLVTEVLDTHLVAARNGAHAIGGLHACAIPPWRARDRLLRLLAIPASRTCPWPPAIL